MLGSIGRFAGSSLSKLIAGIPKEELALRLGTDAIGGLMAAAYTPGDLGDRLIAGTSATLGGAAGGLALGKLGGDDFATDGTGGGGALGAALLSADDPPRFCMTIANASSNLFCFWATGPRL